MLISSNFSSMNSNKAWNYKKNVNSKNNLDNLSQRKSMQTNPNFRGIGTTIGLIGLGLAALGGIIFINDKTNIISSVDNSFNKVKVKERKKARESEFLKNYSQEDLKNYQEIVKARALRIKVIRRAKKVAKRVSKEGSKLAKA